jgi:8-oxo-dGTP pyrophosphatase MutT (NUDIX family)
MLDKLKIQVDGIFYTNGQKKAQKLYELGSSLHYDDDPSERDAIVAYKKLHPNNIVVKNPDELLEDINEVAKGLILTNDNQIVIAQRSDSLEWDAPGGHLMQGEEANFAFYREILEELSLKTKKIDYLASLNTTWKKKNKLVHYFVGRIPYNSDELEGVIQLQWEIESYFCGTLQEIEDKMGEGATHNLKNAIGLFKEENLMLERAYPHSDNHATKKRRLVGMGDSQTTGAHNLKRVRNFERSKSAPAGFGVLEEKEVKKNKKIKISIISSIDEKRKRKKRRKKRKKRRNFGAMFPYGGSHSTIDSDFGDGGGDGGGGE